MMKVILTIILLIGVLLVGIGCQGEEGAAPSPASPTPAEAETPGSVSTINCQILTTEEVSAISGIEVNFEERGPQPELEACRGFYKKYEKSLAGSLGIAYLILDPKAAIDACISPEQSDNPNIAPAEKGTSILNGGGCLSGDGQHVKIAVKDHVIHVWNNSKHDPLLTQEQLIQVAEIIAERIPLE
jgi:hypothetical protein